MIARVSFIACRMIQLRSRLSCMPHLRMISSALSSTGHKNVHICKNHWPENANLEKTKEGRLRPMTPPSIFSVSKSCLPTHKSSPRPSKAEYATHKLFDEKDLFSTFDAAFNNCKTTTAERETRHQSFQ